MKKNLTWNNQEALSPIEQVHKLIRVFSFLCVCVCVCLGGGGSQIAFLQKSKDHLNKQRNGEEGESEI